MTKRLFDHADGASSAARAASASASTTSETRPHASASSAPSLRFDDIHSNARDGPRSRLTKNVPPASGMRPIPMKPGTKLAASDAMRMSHAHASESPAPAHAPFTEAITGFSSERIASTFGGYVARNA